MKRHLLLPVVGLIVLVVSVIFYFNQSTIKNNSRDEVSSLIFETPDFSNNELINENTLGEFYIVNFFASWCKPCLAEHPLLMEMKRKGVKIIGINFRDDEENFKEWISEHGNPFEYILRDDGNIAYEMGLIGVPETFFIINKIIQKNNNLIITTGKKISNLLKAIKFEVNSEKVKIFEDQELLEIENIVSHSILLICLLYTSPSPRDS